MTTAKKVTGDKAASQKVSAKGSVSARSMPAKGKDPKGGLTAAGREFFRKTQGSNLKPGVTGVADTPEKMKRKGSFLTRHFTNPRGPMLDEKEEPTRLALSAHAWGEPVPKTEAAAKRLAAKGRKLLEQYHAEKDKLGKEIPSARKKPEVKTPPAKPPSAKRYAGKKVAQLEA